MKIKEIKIKEKGIVAYTDFSAIYLSKFLRGDDYEVARIHELSHIWLQHQIRSEIFKEKNKNINHEVLNIALDCEIAIHIYTDEEDAVINKPRTMLVGGIDKKFTAKLKSKHAEEIYFELLKNKTNAKNFDKHIFKDNGKRGKSEKKKNIKDIISKAKQEAKKENDKLKKQKTEKILKKQISDFKPPKPSLSSEIDSVFGRNKIRRERSYRRPSRTEHNNDLIYKGMISKKKIPKLTVYVDRSGSFCSDKTVQSTSNLKKIIQKYRGKIKQDAIYFNNVLFSIDTGVGSGGTNYNAVIRHIADNNSELSVIITDNDGAKREDNVAKKIELKKIIIIPIGCARTDLSQKYNIKEVTI